MRSVRFIPSLALALALAAAAIFVRADGTSQSLPFAQDWTNPALITVNDDWDRRARASRGSSVRASRRDRRRSADCCSGPAPR